MNIHDNVAWGTTMFRREERDFTLWILCVVKRVVSRRRASCVAVHSIEFFRIYIFNERAGGWGLLLIFCPKTDSK